MKSRFILFLLLVTPFLLSAEKKTVEFRIIETSDIHGCYLPYDYIEQCERKGSLAHIATYIKEQRKLWGNNLLLFDNGDILEGQPIAYYYNFIDTVSPHVCPEMLNYLKYDVGNFGNHDIETGQTIFKRIVNQCNFPVLGANIIRKSTGLPYTTPYKVFEREGVRIVVLGMITPAIPVWVSKNLWRGIEFEDMEQSARKWMKVIKEKENPDVIIGLFHSGKNARLLGDKYIDDASMEVAKNVPGFDVILFGHDHIPYCEKILNMKGDSVLMVNPGARGKSVAEVCISLNMNGNKVKKMQITGEVVDVTNKRPDPDFISRYQKQHEEINRYVSEKIGVLTETITTRPAYFGPSAFVDFIHSIQLDISGADISFASPLSFDTRIEGGNICIKDMFKLYKFKNLIYTMNLSGKEIKNYLEESYGIWTNQMKSPDDHILQIEEGEAGKSLFTNYYVYFDSAAGIIYTVDVTQPKGQKVRIISMANGDPFELNKTYKVAMTSYRGSGGGELLVKGAGIALEELDERIEAISPQDFRYYLIDYIGKNRVINPRVYNHWKFIPEQWTVKAIERDYRYLFGDVEK